MPPPHLYMQFHTTKLTLPLLPISNIPKTIFVYQKMSTCVTYFLLFLAMAPSISPLQLDLTLIQVARVGVLEAKNWVQTSIITQQGLGHGFENNFNVALTDCAKLYDKSEAQLTQLLSGRNYTAHDARTWLSGVLANHRSCLDSLEEKGFVEADSGHLVAQNLTMLLSEALGLFGNDDLVKENPEKGVEQEQKPEQNGGMLASWSAADSRADYVVAKDGSGTHRTINEAVAAVSKLGHRRPERLVIYVKSGVYNENVEIERQMKNLMFVGDGMDKTIVTAHKNVPDGSTTFGSATLGVLGDGFWARDMTFENTAGPHKHQAVALRVSSDLSIFYRCSIKGYQDTLFVHSSRQFYRDCHVYGTIDFIFGDASVVLQNCDIFIKKPMQHQANMITAQGRDNPKENTGITIHNSRVRPSPEFSAVKNSFKSYLGRPWKKYSRTVFMKTNIDGVIDPKGWKEWEGDFGLSTLYYGEYMNTGEGASTKNRVKWPGFHVLHSPWEAGPFSVQSFIHGHMWIPTTGVPCWLGI